MVSIRTSFAGLILALLAVSATDSALAGALGNASSRAFVGSGDDVLIAGFIVQGNAAIDVLIGVQGPSLSAQGVSGVLQDPIIRLYQGATLLAENDDWMDGASAAALSSGGFTPADPREPALLTSLGPGAYTVVVSGKNDSVGVALAAVFDAAFLSNPAATPGPNLLGNLSARSYVGNADDLLIAGLIVNGSDPVQVLLDARGSSLADLGVAGALTDPLIQLYAGQTLLMENDDWQSGTDAATLSDNGWAPAHPLEPALLATLSPGAYTVIVQGYNGGTGVASVEVFDTRLLPGSVTNPGTNVAPQVFAQSLQVDLTVPYVQKQLIATDANGDTLRFELMAPPSGSGYSQAYLNPDSGQLYVTVINDGTSIVTLPFRASDGLLFSTPANVTIQIDAGSPDDGELGRIDQDAETYAGFDIASLNADLLNSPGGIPRLPDAVDLTHLFPFPGDQGAQSSCVGWATAYALKSYQEHVEENWSLNVDNHLFSPAWVYNQINGGQDQGSLISDALSLIRSSGAASLATMPYDPLDYRSQPGPGARQEAAAYPALAWSRVSGTTQIKAALANRRPVVVGIDVYADLNSLRGSDPVYNSAAGNRIGGHAVTIIGYDDARYGGAFKLINSWGQGWGDGGYFWMPYDFAASGVLREAYVLEDAANGDAGSPGEVTEPVPVGALPNLTVQTWEASYDPRPNGSGSLAYTILNAGDGVAAAGFDVNLMLSTNPTITSADTYVIYEEIPFDLQPGGSASRSTQDGNRIDFAFPDSLQAGDYYMAVWVDDLQEVTESSEQDNISVGNNFIRFENQLPDLAIDHWYAEWDGAGNGTLTYNVSNRGNSQVPRTDWYINLMLSSNETITSSDYFLFYEQAGFVLQPGGSIYRDAGNPAFFTLGRTQSGNSVPPGLYYMALWLDDLQVVEESNELNNISQGQSPVRIGLAAQRRDAGPWRIQEGAQQGRIYNGRNLPPPESLLRKVRVAKTAQGGTSLQLLDGPPRLATRKSTESGTGKVSRAANHGIFPAGERIALPPGLGRHDK